MLIQPRDLSTELDFARDVAALGARIAMGHFRSRPKADRKVDGSYVTEADWKAEAQIRLRIARTWPDHNVLGEEGGLTAAGGGDPIDGAPTWVVDPIDGTNNYMAEIPIWATLIGLEIDGQSVVGVCHAPALGETYHAARGHGAFMNERAIAVDDATGLDNGLVVLSGLERFVAGELGDFYAGLVTRARRSRGFGDFWGHMLVARGAAQVMVEPDVNHWDIAPLMPIVSEAGGRLTHLDGSPWSGRGSALTAPPRVHDRVVALAEATRSRR